MPTPTEEIKSKLDVVDFLRGYLEVHPAGKNFKARCPFHKEKTPSFMISPDRQTWHCFGCALGGDIFEFIMRYENLEFSEALAVLADKAGVQLRRLSPADQKQFGVLYDLNEAAALFFIKSLPGSPGEEYLSGRKLAKGTIEEFRLGFAPTHNDALLVHLVREEGFNVEDIERAGLVLRSERRTYFDRFRGRVMFPIANHLGKTVGFTGRILPQFDTGKTGKYVNSPETAIFNKSHVLYGLHKAREFIHNEKTALLVEGQMDFLMSWQDGVRNVVATSGTSLTPDHLKVLKRHAEKLVVSFDNDEAGLAAGERALDMAMANDFDVRVLRVREGKDPADVVEKSPGRLGELVKNAVPAPEFYFERYLGSIKGKDIGELKRGIRAVLQKIKNIGSVIEQAHWLRELSHKTGFEERVLVEEMAKLKSQTSKEKFGGDSAEVSESKRTRQELLSEHVLSLVMWRNELIPHFESHAQYLPVDYGKIYDMIRGIITTPKEGRLQELFALISLRSGLESSNIKSEDVNMEFEILKKELHRESFKERRANLLREIKEAERRGEDGKVAALLAEFQKFSKEI